MSALRDRGKEDAGEDQKHRKTGDRHAAISQITSHRISSSTSSDVRGCQRRSGQFARPSMRNRQVYGNAEGGAAHSLAQQHNQPTEFSFRPERFCAHNVPAKGQSTANSWFTALAVIPIEHHDRLHRRAHRSARLKALNLLYEVPAHDQLSVPTLMVFLGVSKQAHEN